MAKFQYKNGVQSVILRVKLLDTTSTVGAGKTGLTNSSAGLNIAIISDVEATTTAYTSSGSTIDTISTLGTFAAPTAGHCRFKELDSTNHPGIYEIQIADARWAVSGARSSIVTVQATGAAQNDAETQLSAVDPNDGVRSGLTALPNAAAAASGGLLTVGTGSGQITPDGSTGAVALSAAALTAVAGAVWNALTASYNTANTFGAFFQAQLANAVLSGAQTAAAVWNALTASYQAANSFGAFLQAQLTNAVPTAATVATSVWANATRTLTAFSFTNISANVVQWLGSAPATPDVAGVPKVEVASYATGEDPVTLLNAGAYPSSPTSGTWGHAAKNADVSLPNTAPAAANGLPILGSNAAGIALNPTTGTALTLNGGTNGHGLDAVGNGTASGIHTAGGATGGDGLHAIAGAGGNGITAIGDPAGGGHGGLSITGYGSQPGITILGGNTGGTGDAIDLDVGGSGTAVGGSAGFLASINTELAVTAGHGTGLWGPSNSSGEFTVAITVERSDTSATLQNVLVTIKDAADSTIIFQGLTNLSGVVTTTLDAATYTIHVGGVPGFNALGPQTLVVSANTTHTYQLTPTTIPSPPAAGLCSVVFYAYLNGVAQSGYTCNAYLESNNQATSDALQSQVVDTGTTDVNGRCILYLIQIGQFTNGSAYYNLNMVAADGVTQVLAIRAQIPNVSTVNVQALIPT